MGNRSFAFQTFVFLSAAIVILLGVAVGAKVDERWFDLYGGAAALLAAIPFLQWTLWRGLRARGRNAWASFIVTLPLGLAALLQIGFWAAFFNDPGMAVNLGVVRGALWDMLGPYAEWIVAAYATLSAYVVIKALG